MSDKQRRIRNWEKFQHYQTGKRSQKAPDWIKLYPRLLNDYEYGQLEDKARIILIELFMLASEYGGSLPNLNVICFRLRRHEKEVKAVLDKLPHWIETENSHASNVLADCYQPASLEEKRVEGEEKREEKRDTSASADLCEQAVYSYNLVANQFGLPECRKLTPERDKKLRALLKTQGIGAWNEALRKVPRQGFLLGESESGWLANFDFLLQPRSFQKVLEGAYANGPPRTAKTAATVGVYDRIIAETENESNVINLQTTRLQIGSARNSEANTGKLHATASGPANNISLPNEHARGSAPCDVEPDDESGPWTGS